MFTWWLINYQSGKIMKFRPSVDKDEQTKKIDHESGKQGHIYRVLLKAVNS